MREYNECKRTTVMEIKYSNIYVSYFRRLICRQTDQMKMYISKRVKMLAGKLAKKVNACISRLKSKKSLTSSMPLQSPIANNFWLTSTTLGRHPVGHLGYILRVCLWNGDISVVLCIVLSARIGKLNKRN